MKNDLSLYKILMTDYISFISWLAPLAFFFAYLFTANTYAVAASNLLFLTIGCAGGGLMLILWRIWHFFSLYANGQSVEGQIQKVFFYRTRGTITYTYLYRNQQFSKSIVINKALHNFPYQIGESVTIVMDPENPQRSFILEFFAQSRP